MSTFIEDDPKRPKPVEFTDVIKPADIDSSASHTTVETQQDANIAASISESKEWKPFLSQLNDTQIRDVKKYAPQDQFQIEVDDKLKTFIRKKIKTRDYTQLEELRASLVTATGRERSKLSTEILQKSAYYYLGMSQEDFDACDFETLKKILDAQNIRTLYGVPNSP